MAKAPEAKTPEVDNAPVPEGATVAAAAGATSLRGKGARRNLVEEAMTAAVGEVSKEAEAIWAQTDIDQDEKSRRIQEIMSPDALRERKLKARAQATGRDRELNTELSKAQTEEAKSE